MSFSPKKLSLPQAHMEGAFLPFFLVSFPEVRPSLPFSLASTPRRIFLLSSFFLMRSVSKGRRRKVVAPVPPPTALRHVQAGSLHCLVGFLLFLTGRIPYIDGPSVLFSSSPLLFPSPLSP